MQGCGGDGDDGGDNGDPCLWPRQVRAVVDTARPDASCGTAAGTVSPPDLVAPAANDGIFWCCLPQLTFLQDHYYSRVQPHQPCQRNLPRDQIMTVLRQYW